MSKKKSFAELHWSLPFTVLGLFDVLALEQLTSLDLEIQDHLFDAAAGGWLIDPRAALSRWLLYRLPKMLLWLFGLGVLALALGPPRWRERWGFLRRDLWVLFVILAVVPLSVGALKSVTRVCCPNELERYGGDRAYVKIFDAYPPEQQPQRPGRCFPAAQASGGFALMGLLAIGRRPGRYRRGFLAGSAAGWLLGLYQMARGAHFASHTLAAWLWAWLLAILIDHFWPRGK
jgi:membrane-associated PAP2 superfamily phosphatase